MNGSTIRGLLLVLVVAALAGTDLVRHAAAEPVSSPAGSMTPASFESGCLAGGGEAIEIYGANGAAIESSCSIGGTLVSECDWTSGMCVDYLREVIEPTPAGPLGGLGVDLGGDGVTVENRPEPTPIPTSPPEPDTAQTPATEPDSGPTPETEPTAAPTMALGSAGQTPQADPGGPSFVPGTDSPDAASLTLVVRTCAPGYDPFAQEADPERECPDQTDGVAFRLAGSTTGRATGTDATRATGDDGAGTAAFADLAPGAYRLVAPLPTIGAFSFVSGCASNVRDFDAGPFVPFSMVAANGMLGLTLEPGETLACDWYDVPSQGLDRA